MNGQSIINAEFLRQYTIILKYFKFTGIDLLDQEKWIFFKYSYILELIILVFCTISHCAYLVTEVVRGINLIDLSVDVSFCLVAAEACILYFIFCVHKKCIKNCILEMSTAWHSDDTLEPESILIKKGHLKPIFLFSSWYPTVLTIFMLLYVFSPIVHTTVVKFLFMGDVHFGTPFHFLLPFNYKNNYFLFVIVYLFDFIAVVNLTYLMNLGLLILIITMNNLKTLFVLLQNDFKIFFDIENNFQETKMKIIIQRHINLLEMIHKVGKAFGGIFAVHLVFVSGTITFFCLSARINGDLEDLKNICACFVLVITLFFCCLYGQLLSDSSINVSAKIFESKWYNIPKKYKHIMLIITQRSQRCTYIKSISLAEISLNIFVKVMKMTWSLVSLTSTIYQES